MENKKSFMKLLSFIVQSIFAGASIGIGATASFLANSYANIEGKIIGAVLFSLGIFVIVIFDMKLFTGLPSKFFEIEPKRSWKYPLCFLGNAVGVLFVWFLVSFCPIGDIVNTLSANVIALKLSSQTWAISALLSSIACGILITFSVMSAKRAKDRGLSGTLGVIFPIIVFAFCGFDHSVANMFGFFAFGQLSWQIVGYVALTMVGNFIGGILLPCILKLKEKIKE